MDASRSDQHAEDARLVARATAGDQGAFRQLFEAYSPLIFRIVQRMVDDREDAAEVTQDVFVRAFQRLGSLRDGQAFYAWITRLAVNMAHDHLRRRRPPALSLNAPPPGMDESAEWQLPSDDPDSEERLLAGELSEHVQRALLALSPDHRIVVVLHHLEAMPVEKIAEILRVPEGTVKSRLSRARVELRRLLADYVEA